MTAAHPLDPTGATVHADAAALRETAAACPVTLPGDVPGMIVSRHRELRDFLADPKVAKNARHFAAFQEGRVPEQWQLNAFALVNGMTTADGEDHRRLRGWPARRSPRAGWPGCGPGSRSSPATCWARCPGTPDADGEVDLREHFAYPLPMGVICELLGVGPAYRDRLHAHPPHGQQLATAAAAVAMAAQGEIHAMLGRGGRGPKRARPGRRPDQRADRGPRRRPDGGRRG